MELNIAVKIVFKKGPGNPYQNYGPCGTTQAGLGSKDPIFPGGARMENIIDNLFQEWHRLGGAVLISDIKPNQGKRDVEIIIAESNKLMTITIVT